MALWPTAAEKGAVRKLQKILADGALSTNDPNEALNAQF